jgi:hypothetical protein
MRLTRTPIAYRCIGQRPLNRLRARRKQCARSVTRMTVGRHCRARPTVDLPIWGCRFLGRGIVERSISGGLTFYGVFRCPIVSLPDSHDERCLLSCSHRTGQQSCLCRYFDQRWFRSCRQVAASARRRARLFEHDRQSKNRTSPLQSNLRSTKDRLKSVNQLKSDQVVASQFLCNRSAILADVQNGLGQIRALQSNRVRNFVERHNGHDEPSNQDCDYDYCRSRPTWHPFWHGLCPVGAASVGGLLLMCLGGQLLELRGSFQVFRRSKYSGALSRRTAGAPTWAISRENQISQGIEAWSVGPACQRAITLPSRQIGSARTSVEF